MMMWRSLAVAVVVMVVTVECILMGVDASDDGAGTNMVRGAAHPPSPGSPTSPTHSLALWW